MKPINVLFLLLTVLDVYVCIWMCMYMMSPGKDVLKAELCFHRYVHFTCVPIYIFGLHHKQCAND